MIIELFSGSGEGRIGGTNRGRKPSTTVRRGKPLTKGGQPTSARVQPQSRRVQPIIARIQPQSTRAQQKSARVQQKSTRLQQKSTRVQPQSTRVQPQSIVITQPQRSAPRQIQKNGKVSNCAQIKQSLIHRATEVLVQSGLVSTREG